MTIGPALTRILSITYSSWHRLQKEDENNMLPFNKFINEPTNSIIKF